MPIGNEDGIELPVISVVRPTMICALLTACLAVATMPLGVGLQDASQLRLINQKLIAGDHVSAHSEQLALLSKVQNADLVFILRGAEFADAARLIGEAKKVGVRLVGFNLEGPLGAEELASKEKAVADVVHAAGMTFLFAPTARSLQTGYKSFVGPADAIMVQSQHYETASDYRQTVSALIAKLKAAKPGLKVWVQVTVNPPGDRNIAVDEVLQRVGDLHGIADGVFVFWAPFRRAAGEVVVARLRP